VNFVTAGESHGPQLTIIVTGLPAGLRLDRERINADLRRRQHGYGRGGRMKIESDEAEITAGVRGGETLGSPIAITIRNRDNWRGAHGHSQSHAEVH
jgi:chorismate synthase